MKKNALIICPGRGTYDKGSLGYLQRYHVDNTKFVEWVDAYRREQQQIPISELDQAQHYRLTQHNTGDNASALIYTCALADFQSIDRDKFTPVAITGNSMGWYLALAAGGAASLRSGLEIVNTMGTLMHREAQGGQVIYPRCNDDWQLDRAIDGRLRETIDRLQREENITLYDSIHLGLMAVLAASTTGVQRLMAELPALQGRFPLAIPNHGAFHSPLMQPISRRALSMLSPSLLQAPEIPLIDGRGRIWQRYATDPKVLYGYTFDHQVCSTYDYSKAVEVGCKEFAPDCCIVLGPGNSLGAPTAQQLIAMRWRGIDSKQAFKHIQQKDPFIYSMGIEEQRALVSKNKSR